MLSVNELYIQSILQCVEISFFRKYPCLSTMGAYHTKCAITLSNNIFTMSSREKLFFCSSSALTAAYPTANKFQENSGKDKQSKRCTCAKQQKYSAVYFNATKEPSIWALSKIMCMQAVVGWRVAFDATSRSGNLGIFKISWKNPPPVRRMPIADEHDHKLGPCWAQTSIHTMRENSSANFGGFLVSSMR